MRYNLIKSILLGIGACGLFGMVGCEISRNLNTSFPPPNAVIPTQGPSYLERAQIAVPDPEHDVDIHSISPVSAIDYANVQYQEITLEQCVRDALAGSEVFRELGGVIVNQPATIQTALDPALQFTDPLLGEEAALSAFDAVLSSGLFAENNDRPFNNAFSGGDGGIFQQDLLTSNAQISKLAATGTQFTSSSTVIYDANNQTGNQFGSTWEAIIDTGFRHPLLQGGGTLFNRIAGPSVVPGQYNGVLIARTNTEINLADFEDSVREFVSNVENAYWDLFYAYRELEAQTGARDAAAAVAKTTRVLREQEKIGQLELASANEQLLRFESSIIESLEGRLIDGTQSNSGTSGGTFLRTIGVRTAERRLRYLLGMPITDGTLLKPSEEPTRAPLAFDWDASVNSALNNRPETRRQHWLIKQRQLELTAARNFLLPRLDVVGNHRFRGLGQELAGSGESFPDADSNAVTDLFTGDFQELSLGFELSLPVGFRQAHAAVRNAALNVQREKAILKEQERKIVLDLSNVVAECRRSFNAMQVADQRYQAAVEYRAQADERVKNGRSQYDVLLEAQRRILEAQIQFINAEVEYAIAIKNVHFERGSYLTYHGVHLSESQSDGKVAVDYARRKSRLTQPISYAMRDPAIGVPGDGTASVCSSCEGDGGCSSCTSGSQPIVHAVSDGTVFAAGGPPAPTQQIVTFPVEEFPATEEVKDEQLPPTGQGKKHVYNPKFLPPPVSIKR